MPSDMSNTQKGRITKMKKRIITLVLIALITASFAIGAAAFDSNSDAQRLLGVLGIMNGDQNGELFLEREVTRAEFSKMLVKASSYKDSVSTAAIATGFSDVSAEHWAAPYIRIAAANKWIYGYSDGRFAPSDNIRLEEAATMLLRVLGYSSADITGVYPSGQIALYESLGLDNGIKLKTGNTVTRGDCVNLFVNLLNAKSKSGQIYAQTLGYSLNTDGKIDINKTISDELDGPYVLENGIGSLPTDISGFTIYKNDSAVTQADIESYDVAYISIALRSVWLYDDTVTGKYIAALPSLASPASVTVGSASYKIETPDAARELSFMGRFQPDDMVTLLLGKDGGVVAVYSVDEHMQVDEDNLLELIEGTLEGPFVVTDTYSSLGLPTENITVKRNNKPSSVSDIKKYDVVYYSQPAKTLLVYSKTVSGTYMSASPSTDTPTHISVAGNSYKLADSKVAFAVSTLGSFAPGDMITLLLGRADEIAGVVDMSVYANNVYGVVLDVASENYTDHLGLTYSAQTLTLMSTEGDTLKLEGVVNTLDTGDVVKVSYTDKVNVSRVKSRSVTGKVTQGYIGDKKLADDVNIIETGVYGKNPVPVFFSRLAAATLTDKDVRYYALDSQGNISDIILANFTGDSYSYGIVTEAENSDGLLPEDPGYSQETAGNYSYKFQIGTSAYSIKALTALSYSTGPSAFIYNGKALEEITPLKKLPGIDLYTSFGIVSNSQLYLFSDNMTVYTPNTNKQSALEYSTMSISELTNNIDTYNIRAYYDTAPKNGGRIRIIIATKK